MRGGGNHRAQSRGSAEQSRHSLIEINTSASNAQRSCLPRRIRRQVCTSPIVATGLRGSEIYGWEYMGRGALLTCVRRTAEIDHHAVRLPLKLEAFGQATVIAGTRPLRAVAYRQANLPGTFQMDRAWFSQSRGRKGHPSDGFRVKKYLADMRRTPLTSAVKPFSQELSLGSVIDPAAAKKERKTG